MEAYKFVPFAIERDGAWGSEAHQAFGSIVEAVQAGVDAEAFHWSAMNFERHWRQRVAVALGRGQALCQSGTRMMNLVSPQLLVTQRGLRQGGRQCFVLPCRRCMCAGLVGEF